MDAFEKLELSIAERLQGSARLRPQQQGIVAIPHVNEAVLMGPIDNVSRMKHCSSHHCLFVLNLVKLLSSFKWMG